MYQQGLLAFAALAALNCLCYGEVVNKHFSKCQSSFYKNKPPQGLDSLAGSAYICQTFGNVAHYATHFSKTHRIPIYSAYRLDTLSCPAGQPSRRSTWFTEPQLYRANFPKNMELAGVNTDNYKGSQAINKDYPNTNFDKGHLNPNFYQCNNARVATFTLTNSVPQDPCFNQQSWKQMEEAAKSLMASQCRFPGAKRYFVTGAIPTTKTIPNRGHDLEGDTNREYNRVSVPSGMWTAACCDSSAATNTADKRKGFSFAYYGDNVPDSWVIPSSVSGLQRKLGRLYGVQLVDIFADSCFESADLSKRAVEKMAVPVERKAAEALISLGKSGQSSMPSSKRRYMNTVGTVLSQSTPVTLQDWRVNDVHFGMLTTRGENQGVRSALKSNGLSTVLMQTKTVRAARLLKGSNEKPKTADKTQALKEERKHENPKSGKPQLPTSVDSPPSSDGGSDLIDSVIASRTQTNEDKYLIVSSTSSTRSANGASCRSNHPCNFYGQKYKWCYTDWKDSWDYCCTGPCDFHKGTDYHYCDSGNTWAYCSQPSSMLTVVNRPCRPDHACAARGEKYYWCYTDTKQSWEYCCQPWHDCLKHGENYNWCYVGYQKGKGTWKTCNY